LLGLRQWYGGKIFLDQSQAEGFPLHSLFLAASGGKSDEQEYLGTPQTPPGWLLPPGPPLKFAPMGTPQTSPGWLLPSGPLLKSVPMGTPQTPPGWLLPPGPPLKFAPMGAPQTSPGWLLPSGPLLKFAPRTVQAVKQRSRDPKRWHHRMLDRGPLCKRNK